GERYAYEKYALATQDQAEAIPLGLFRVEIASGRITAPPRNLLWKSLQGSRLPIRHGRARPIHDHSQKCVITVDAQHVHDTLLAETRQCTIVGGVRNALVRMQLAAEVIDDLFVLGHS